MKLPELSNGEKLRHNYHERKARAYHYEIKAELDRFTVFMMEVMRLEGMSDKACRRVVYHVGKLRRTVLTNSREQMGQNLHASAAMEKLQKALHYLKQPRK